MYYYHMIINYKLNCSPQNEWKNKLNNSLLSTLLFRYRYNYDTLLN